MKVVAIVQARMGSTRFPKKVMCPIQGRPMIDLLLERLSRSTRIDSIVLATSDQSSDDELASHIQELGYLVTRGSERNVLAGYWRAAQPKCLDVIVWSTGDCPPIDLRAVDVFIKQLLSGAEYVVPLSLASNDECLTVPAMWSAL